jgi:hypothetical protein
MLRLTWAMILASVAALVSFGLLLGLFWSLGEGGDTYGLVTSILAAACAIGLGGFITAWASKADKPAPSFLFGFLFGGLSFTYILGIGVLAFLLALVSGGVSGTGGIAFRWLFRRRPSEGVSAG